MAPHAGSRPGPADGELLAGLKLQRPHIDAVHLAWPTDQGAPREVTKSDLGPWTKVRAGELPLVSGA